MIAPAAFAAVLVAAFVSGVSAQDCKHRELASTPAALRQLHLCIACREKKLYIATASAAAP